MRLFPAALLAIAGGGASALLLPAATAQHGAATPLSESDAGRTIAVPRGAVVTVALDHAAGTGYAWRYVSQAGILPVDARTTSAVTAGTVRGPQVQTFQFRIVARHADVAFALARPWEKDRPPVRTVRYAFTFD